jgi:hypothetical protein
MLLRRVLIRLLLLAVCFHTVVGRPAHEATHLLQQRIARVALPAEGAPPSAWPAIDIAAIAFETDAGAGARTGVLDGAAIGQGGQSGHGGSAEALCAWCAALSQLASALAASPPAPLASATMGGQPVPRREVAFVPRPDRWRFAARDPPGHPPTDPLARRGPASSDLS